jgi:hypothetical protein
MQRNILGSSPPRFPQGAFAGRDLNDEASNNGMSIASKSLLEKPKLGSSSGKDA